MSSLTEKIRSRNSRSQIWPTLISLCFPVLWVGIAQSVGIAPRYELDGPESTPGGGRDFPHPSRPALGPTQPPIQWAPVLFPGAKAAGTWRWPLTPSNAEVKERVEQHLYSPSGPSCSVLGWNELYVSWLQRKRNFVSISLRTKGIMQTREVSWLYQYPYDSRDQSSCSEVANRQLLMRFRAFYKTRTFNAVFTSHLPSLP